MAAWDKKYVSTNVKAGSRSYDRDLFIGITSNLSSSHAKLKNIAYAVIVCYAPPPEIQGCFADSPQTKRQYPVLRSEGQM